MAIKDKFSERKVDVFSIVMGILFCLLSIPLFCNLVAGDVAIAVCAGVAFLVSGIGHIVLYAKLHKIQDDCGVLIFQAIIDILLGVIFLANIGAALFTLNFLFGFGFVFYGIVSICSVFSKAVRAMTPWVVILIFGILSVLFGCAFINRGWGLVIMPIILAITVLANGIKMIVDGAHGYVVKK